MERPDHINDLLTEMEISKNYKELKFNNPVVKYNGFNYHQDVERMFLGLKNSGYHKDMVCIFTKDGYEVMYRGALDNFC